MHDGRGSFAASEAPRFAEGSAEAWANERRARTTRGGRGRGLDAGRRPAPRRATREPGGTADDRPVSGNEGPVARDATAVDQPALPPPLGAPAGTPEAGDDRGGPGGRARTSRSDSPDPLRVIEILSHELRSPITTIHLGTKMLREQGHRISRPVRAEVVEAVEEEAERLYRLVEDLLAVARHQGDAAPLPVGPIALQHWLPPILAAEVQAAPSLRVRASIPPDLPPVLADDGALAQVIRNLLGNVTRFAPEGMPAEIVAWPPEDGTIRLEVLDRGPGVEPDEADRLFEPFYRSPGALEVGSGAGLGLAAAHRLMRAMQGSIEAQPREGGGARFVLRLPVAIADAEADAPNTADDRGLGQV
jgi:signal transduction histidine kinase